MSYSDFVNLRVVEQLPIWEISNRLDLTPKETFDYDNQCEDEYRYNGYFSALDRNDFQSKKRYTDSQQEHFEDLWLHSKINSLKYGVKLLSNIREGLDEVGVITEADCIAQRLDENLARFIRFRIEDNLSLKETKERMKNLETHVMIMRSDYIFDLYEEFISLDYQDCYKKSPIDSKKYLQRREPNYLTTYYSASRVEPRYVSYAKNPIWGFNLLEKKNENLEKQIASEKSKRENLESELVLSKKNQELDLKSTIQKKDQRIKDQDRSIEKKDQEIENLKNRLKKEIKKNRIHEEWFEWFDDSRKAHKESIGERE